MNNDLLNSLLKGASKSLYIINEAIPIYKDTAPIVKKVKNYVVNKKDNIKVNNNKEIKKELVTNENSNNPKFFV